MTTSKARNLGPTQRSPQRSPEGWLTKYANRKEGNRATSTSAINELIEDFAKFAVDYWTYLNGLVEASNRADQQSHVLRIPDHQAVSP